MGRERRKGEGRSRAAGRSRELPGEEAAAVRRGRRGRGEAAAANSPPFAAGRPLTGTRRPAEVTGSREGDTAVRPPCPPPWAFSPPGRSGLPGPRTPRSDELPRGRGAAGGPPEGPSPRAPGGGIPPSPAPPALSSLRPAAPMALSKGLRLLWKQEPGPSALLEARTRQDCLLLEAGTVAALSKCPAAGRAGPGRAASRAVRVCGAARGEVACLWVRARCLCGARGTRAEPAEGCRGAVAVARAREVWGIFPCGVERGRGERRAGPSGTLASGNSLASL